MKKILIAFTLTATILSSCGAGKKMTVAKLQIETLTNESTSLRKQIADDQQAVDQLKAQSVQTSAEIENCRSVNTAMSERLDHVNSVLAEKSNAMKEIRAKMDAALSEFRDAGAEITYHNGLVYISMADKLRFPSGSTKISDRGRQALSVVADVLADYPGVSAVIVGNTDSIAIRRRYTDNWSLSTERANVLVRILRDNYQADPARITAAGKGQYSPLADNNTFEGRAINRRADIVLNPDLSIIWTISTAPE